MRFDAIFLRYLCWFVGIAASLNFLLAFMYCPWLFTSTMTRYTIKFFVQGSVSIKCTKSKSSCKETRLLTVQTSSAVFRIRDILVRIRIWIQILLFFSVKDFLTIFAWWWKDPDPDPYHWITDRDRDPGGAKTYRSYGSESEHWLKHSTAETKKLWLLYIIESVQSY